MVIRKKFILVKRFDGPPKENDFEIVEENLPPLADGEFLAEAEYLSVDPYMRAYVHKLPVGSPMNGRQVARIIESKSDDFPVGKHVFGGFDWQTHTISSKGGVGSPYLVPDLGGLPLSTSLGVLGMPGYLNKPLKKELLSLRSRCTAYFAFGDICKPKSGETVVISGAAGAVGAIVGQTAKIKGCKVIGITGSEIKGKYLVENLNFDSYINYKCGDIEEQLKKQAPEGVDCYFDNVAGEISVSVMKHMNTYGRICNCGSISSYNADVSNPPKVSSIQMLMLTKQLYMEGFQVYGYLDRSDECITQHIQWIKEGKLKNLETITEGFENTTKAFIEMLEGKNLGKAIVKV
ncbi:hypothetical protein FQR65_LT06763 [Abscondita terminalis]|nr:hypothetical protein FQR65_LT06763 [Abscondita terminalis]